MPIPRLPYPDVHGTMLAGLLQTFGMPQADAYALVATTDDLPMRRTVYLLTALRETEPGLTFTCERVPGDAYLTVHAHGLTAGGAAFPHTFCISIT